MHDTCGKEPSYFSGLANPIGQPAWRIMVKFCLYREAADSEHKLAALEGRLAQQAMNTTRRTQLGRDLTAVGPAQPGPGQLRAGGPRCHRQRRFLSRRLFENCYRVQQLLQVSVMNTLQHLFENLEVLVRQCRISWPAQQELNSELGTFAPVKSFQKVHLSGPSYDSACTGSLAKYTSRVY